ncbi:MAG: hypothetical protein WCH98_01160 [Verrucomicrobiota bacterium]
MDADALEVLHLRVTTTRFHKAQALFGLDREAKARALLRDVLARDPNHALAADLLAGSGFE